MPERTMHAPTWFLARRAKALHVPVRLLQQFAQDYGALVTRAGDKVRCEGCGRLLADFGREVVEVRPYVSDSEEGISLCYPCNGGAEFL